jgi:hypothetical protein
MATTTILLTAAEPAALLRDVQHDVPVSPAMWRTIANEANTLANRLYARTSRSAKARRAATDLRMHVREMRAAALKGDAAGARRHAGEALPFAYRLIDWSARGPSYSWLLLQRGPVAPAQLPARSTRAGDVALRP